VDVYDGVINIQNGTIPIISNTSGLAIRNFTTYPEMPDPQSLIAYAVKAEELGFDSVWVWDHIFLGVDPPFPVIDSLTLLNAVAARTTKIKLGTGVLVLPLRNPVVLEPRPGGGGTPAARHGV